jgi:hypothetical protein
MIAEMGNSRDVWGLGSSVPGSGKFPPAQAELGRGTPVKRTLGGSAATSRQPGVFASPACQERLDLLSPERSLDGAPRSEDLGWVSSNFKTTWGVRVASLSRKTRSSSALAELGRGTPVRGPWVGQQQLQDNLGCSRRQPVKKDSIFSRPSGAWTGHRLFSLARFSLSLFPDSP